MMAYLMLMDHHILPHEYYHIFDDEIFYFFYLMLVFSRIIYLGYFLIEFLNESISPKVM